MHGPGIAWAAEQVGVPVASTRELTGGRTSTMLALTHTDGHETVLRLIDREPWRTHGEALASREHETQLVLGETGVPAPRSVALDAVGRHCGHPAHLMTLIPGETDESRVDDASLRALAECLATIHAVVPATPARAYQSWAWEAKYTVPEWSRHPAAWHEAFALLRTPPPDSAQGFIHRDFQLRNVLWRGERPSGIVDWVETSTGPAWLDVAHCATQIALRHDTERADAFAAAYTAVTGRRGDPYWDVMDLVGLLPAPGREPGYGSARERGRLEQHLLARLAQRST